MATIGIYVIENQVTGQAYVGISRTPMLRWQAHRQHLRKGRHSNPLLQQAWREYGERAFTFALIDQGPDALGIYSAERRWIHHYQRRDGVYNRMGTFEPH